MGAAEDWIAMRERRTYDCTQLANGLREGAIECPACNGEGELALLVDDGVIGPHIEYVLCGDCDRGWL